MKSGDLLVTPICQTFKEAGRKDEKKKQQRNGKKIQETKRHGDVASTEASCIDTRRDTHHTNTHNMEGLFFDSEACFVALFPLSRKLQWAVSLQ